MELPENMTYREALGPAMKITDQAEADEYKKALIDWHVRYHDKTLAEAEAIVNSNIGYYSGYYDHETMIRVQKLFRCAHPILGKAEDKTPTPEEAFQAGVDWAG